MPEFTITQHINTPIESVWEVLDDFGDIQRWNDGVKASELTSDGRVSQGSTRHCDFAPFGAVNERITGYEPNQRMIIHLYETFKLPISDATADFRLAESADGTVLTINYTYTLNRIGRAAKAYTDKQLRKGLGGLATGLQKEAERISAA
jgi:uncharacterized protein YndB with AHSA1/START domain